MKIAYAPYTLNPKDERPPRQGALLCITFEDGSVGYADCHPWESLGDLSLAQQLEGLKRGQLSPLTRRSLHFARIDAEARSRGVSLFAGLQVPASHFLISNILKWQKEDLESILQRGFTCLKVKLGENIGAETQALRFLIQHCDNAVRFRLDFNNQLSKEEFKTFLEEIDREISQIEFFEDPFPYDPSAWRRIQEHYGVALALDYRSERAIQECNSAAFVVVKPALQDEGPFLALKKSKQRMVVTSYLDHPLGQMAAAYVAGQLSRALPEQMVECGLLSHLVYEENLFSRALAKGPQFITPEELGMGFADALSKLSFVALTV